MVIDGATRCPLAAQLFRREPSAAAMLTLLHRAIVVHGAPRVLVTDRGAQFTAHVFRRGARAHGVRHRFGAFGRTGSITRIERLWRTVKDLVGRRLVRPARYSTCEATLQSVLVWYVWHRPHTALDGRTPAERYFRITSRVMPSSRTTRATSSVSLVVTDPAATVSCAPSASV